MQHNFQTVLSHYPGEVGERWKELCVNVWYPTCQLYFQYNVVSKVLTQDSLDLILLGTTLCQECAFSSSLVDEEVSTLLYHRWRPRCSCLCTPGCQHTAGDFLWMRQSKRRPKCTAWDKLMKMDVDSWCSHQPPHTQSSWIICGGVFWRPRHFSLACIPGFQTQQNVLKCYSTSCTCSVSGRLFNAYIHQEQLEYLSILGYCCKQ